jgi:C4-dicarboxylate-specific signal transduction histidine kinase
VLSFSPSWHHRRWSEEPIGCLRRVSDLFANVAGRRAQRQRDRALDFEHSPVELLTSVLRTPIQPAHGIVPLALQSIGEYFGAERVTLWRMSSGDRLLVRSQAWKAAGVREAPLTVRRSDAPQLVDQLLRGKVVERHSLEELPAGGSMDAQRAGTPSLVAVPLCVDGAFQAALTLETVRDDRGFAVVRVPYVMLMGEVLAQVLERDHSRRELMKAQSETAEYRERLAHLVRVHAVGEMSASIAHEINQPLVAIENYALPARRRLTDGAALDTGKLDELLNKIGTQAARAGAVMHRLRAMMKKHEPEARPIDLGRLVSDTMKLMEMASQSLGLQIEITIAADLPQVLADDIQIEQVVLNLARNAIEAMEAACTARKELSIVAHRAGPSDVLVRVADTGPGVAPADVQHLFEAFYSTKSSGLGIGLAISRAIVEAHGGRLGYVPNPAGGAVFEFTLPAATGEL